MTESPELEGRHCRLSPAPWARLLASCCVQGMLPLLNPEAAHPAAAGACSAASRVPGGRLPGQGLHSPAGGAPRRLLARPSGARNRRPGRAKQAAAGALAGWHPLMHACICAPVHSSLSAVGSRKEPKPSLLPVLLYLCVAAAAASPPPAPPPPGLMPAAACLARCACWPLHSTPSVWSVLSRHLSRETPARAPL